MRHARERVWSIDINGKQRDSKERLVRIGYFKTKIFEEKVKRFFFQ